MTLATGVKKLKLIMAIVTGHGCSIFSWVVIEYRHTTLLSFGKQSFNEANNILSVLPCQPFPPFYATSRYSFVNHFMLYSTQEFTGRKVRTMTLKLHNERRTFYVGVQDTLANIKRSAFIVEF